MNRLEQIVEREMADFNAQIRAYDELALRSEQFKARFDDLDLRNRHHQAMQFLKSAIELLDIMENRTLMAQSWLGEAERFVKRAA